MGLHKSIYEGIVKALTGNSQVCTLTLRRCTFLYFLPIEFWSFLGFLILSTFKSPITWFFNFTPSHFFVTLQVLKTTCLKL